MAKKKKESLKQISMHAMIKQISMRAMIYYAKTLPEKYEKTCLLIGIRSLHLSICIRKTTGEIAY